MKIRDHLSKEEFAKELHQASINDKIQEKKKQLIEKITEGNASEGSLENDFYNSVEGIYIQRNDFDLADDNLSVSQKAQKAEYSKKLRNKFTLRKKLN